MIRLPVFASTEAEPLLQALGRLNLESVLLPVLCQLVVIVLVGRARLHRWILFVPNLVIAQLKGTKAVVTVRRRNR